MSGMSGKFILSNSGDPDIRKTLSENIQVIVTYQSKKLSAKFIVKGKPEFYHQSNLVYFGKCPNQTFLEDYIGETDPIINHKRDKNSHIIKRSH